MAVSNIVDTYSVSLNNHFKNYNKNVCIQTYCVKSIFSAFKGIPKGDVA